MDSILYVLEGELNEIGILAEKNNLKLNKAANNEFVVKNNAFRIFNFELYVVEDLADMLEEAATIYEGECSIEEKQLLENLAEKNYIQYSTVFY